MKKHEQELNKAVLPVQEAEQEFTLEDILREFGSEAEKPQPAQEPQRGGKPQKPEPIAPQKAEEPLREQEPPQKKEPRQKEKRLKVMPPPPPIEEVSKPIRIKHPEGQAETKKQKPPKSVPPVQRLSAEELLYECRQKQGRSRLRLAFCVIACLASLFLTVYQGQQLRFIAPLNDRLAAIISVGLLAITLLLCFDVVLQGLQQLFRLRPNVQTMESLCVLFVVLDTVSALQQGRFPCCTVGVLELTFGLWGLSDGILAGIRTLKSLQAAEPPAAVRETENLRHTQSGLYVADGDTEQFLRDFEKPDIYTRVMGIYTPALLLLSLLGGALISTLLHRPFLWCMAVLLTGATPLCSAICYARPFALLARRLQKIGAAICGWEGAGIFSGRHTILISDADLFPKENISLNGMKLLGGHDMNRVISYAASVTAACESPLEELFEELRRTQSCRRYEVRAIRSYEGGGVGADISGEIILMGSLRFMNSMGIHMDAGMRVRQAVYLSINGELACVFAMKYKPAHDVGDGLRAIVEDSHFDAVLVTRDFLLDPAYLQSKYEVPAEQLEYPPVKEREALAAQKIHKGGRQGAILGKNSFAEFATVVAGGRSLRTCVQLGTALTVCCGIFGLLLMGLMAVLGAVETASCMNISLFLLVWALPGLLLSGWTKKK